MAHIFNSQLLTPAEVSEALSVPLGTLNQWRHRGAGPAFIKLPNGRVRYTLTAVQEWVMGQPSFTENGGDR